MSVIEGDGYRIAVTEVSPPLLADDHHALGRYVRELADLMGLRDWTVQTNTDVKLDATNHRFADGQVVASVRIPHGTKSLELTVDNAWSRWDADTLRRVIVHELVHAHLIVMLWAFDNIQNVVGGALFEVLDSAFDDAHELATDAIAVAWAETLPLPVHEADAGPEGAAS